MCVELSFMRCLLSWQSAISTCSFVESMPFKFVCCFYCWLSVLVPLLVFEEFGFVCSSDIVCCVRGEVVSFWLKGYTISTAVCVLLPAHAVPDATFELVRATSEHVVHIKVCT